MRVRWLVIRWAWSFISYVSTTVTAQAGSSSNVSIPITSPQIEYTPFLCNSSITDCSGGWGVQDVNGAPVVSTNGSNAASNIIPQMFLRFKASAIFLQTSTLSNATMNLTISSGNITITSSVLSSVENIAVINIPESETTTMSITYLSDSAPTRLDIESISITVTDNTATGSFLPTQTLPPSIILPSFTPTSTLSATSTSTSTDSGLDHNKLVALAVGLVVGLSLGLTLLTAGLFYLWRRRRLKREPSSPSSESSAHKERSWF